MKKPDDEILDEIRERVSNIYEIVKDSDLPDDIKKSVRKSHRDLLEVTGKINSDHTDE